MATLVLSTVGTALGGPIGGAIGALIGQSFDQQLLAPASRGPRLGDLAIQSSSYGTEIPRVYGSMRVAGSVIWATDLVESEQTTGAKGQPDVTYSYSVSLAVALSSRPVSAIGRIWADGKLLRGMEGDFKVPTTFRFYDGSESHEIDPLIASVEGIANTPAHRGIALAVFEDLELAAFGNRIPFLTFEVFADAASPPVGSILNDASSGMIVSDASDAVIGYAAYGRSIAAAVKPLIDCFDVALFDDGSVLRSPAQAEPLLISSDELGNSVAGEKASTLQRQQLPVRAIPSTLRLSYYDQGRDYQTGEARASAGEPDANQVQQEIPAVLSASAAKTLASGMIAAEWAGRDKLTLRLPPARMTIEPGAFIQMEAAHGTWVADKCTLDSFVPVLELRRSWRRSTSLQGEAGRIVANPDSVEEPTTVALIDVPNMGDTGAGEPSILVAASSPNRAWAARPLAVSTPGGTLATATPTRKSVLGSALTELAAAQPYLVDCQSSVDIQLIDLEQWMTSCEDDALADGANLAVLGSELIQFADVTPLGGGKFRLARLLRGRGGTEWAMGSHAAGETFCLLDGNSVRPLFVPAWMRGSTISAADRNGPESSLTFGAESARPLAPVNLVAALDDSGVLTLTWTRRSRTGFAWLDEVDASLDAAREQYLVTIVGASVDLELATEQPTLVVQSSTLTPVGSGTATIEVRQIGDWSASRPAQITINLP